MKVQAMYKWSIKFHVGTTIIFIFGLALLENSDINFIISFLIFLFTFNILLSPSFPYCCLKSEPFAFARNSFLPLNSLKRRRKKEQALHTKTMSSPSKRREMDLMKLWILCLIASSITTLNLSNFFFLLLFLFFID